VNFLCKFYVVYREFRGHSVVVIINVNKSYIRSPLSVDPKSY